MFGLLLWRAGALDGAMRATAADCLFGIAVCLLAVSWGYVAETYLRRPCDPWKRQPAPASPRVPIVG